MMTVGKVSELSKSRLSALLGQLEKREKDIEELIFEAKGVRADLEMKFVTEISKLQNARDTQVYYNMITL